MKKRKKITYFSREYFVYVPLVLCVFLIVGRLVWLQVIQANGLNAKGIANRMISQTLLPERGIIYDSKGNVLSQSAHVQEIYADPKTLTQLINKHQYTKMSKDDIAKTVGGILGQDSKTILDKLNKDAQWISLAHQVDINSADKIRNLNIPGFGFVDESKRVYPQNAWASSVLGFVNQTGHGIGGVEAYYDKFLFGTLGQSTSEETSNHQLIPDTPSDIQPPKQGDNLTLTLNTTIQSLVEKQLTALETSTQAKSVTIIAMDPQTGKVLGMGTNPTFDPNNFANTPPENWTNRAISMNYEPGSTFKVVTGSAALEEKSISPNELFADPGYIKVGNHTIMNWDYGIRPAGDITFTKGMEQSSNVVLSQVGLRLGLVNFYRYLKSFGFGTKTGIDITGEESGLIIPQNNVKEVELATMSFGQSNMVTPIQLMTALCAVANGGTLYKPYVVDKVTAPDGTIVQQNQPTKIRSVISAETSNEMTKIMESVVTNGTGKLAAIPGINVAGKSGTAQKIDPQTKGYSSSSFIASFEAFAPADNPKIAVLVVVDSPKGGEHEGGPLCSPYAKIILQGALEEFNISLATEVQNSVPITPNDAPVRPVAQPVTPERLPLPSETVVPNLIGENMRQVGETISKSELHFNFSGSGLVSQQNPAGGKVVTKGSVVDVIFAPISQSP
ncbi:penicillin-binding transpeptidase domain-containing protein [Desulfosporosinus sp. Sb-LF]|uniref:penicillin-binding protein n=1 Tax=Desulfosporosinus sp. Sb-LF TaxID=2560027 RepID=UPI00107F9AC3|nr:penicillin-binding transpeptidase domain-containing protein [Desulfosporosinus sp. Sb-LF]TGE31765.1 PASTA domain-containing protein [Desulfosporosinus sp. Sb-LF]